MENKYSRCLSSTAMSGMREYLSGVCFHLGFLSQRKDLLMIFTPANVRAAWLLGSSPHVWWHPWN